MINPIEKYNEIRSQITDGCIGLISKNAIVSKVIRRYDRNEDGSLAEFSHSFLIYEKSGCLFVIESNPKGVAPELLSKVIKSCDNFQIIKPFCAKSKTEVVLEDVFERARKGIAYDFKNGIFESINRRFKTKLRITERDEHDICSDLTRIPAIEQRMVTEKFKSLKLPFPQDYLRYRSKITTILLV